MRLTSRRAFSASILVLAAIITLPLYSTSSAAVLEAVLRGGALENADGISAPGASVLQRVSSGLKNFAFAPAATAPLNVPQSSSQLIAARREHTATLLSNGNILIAGGNAAGSAEIFNATQGNSSATGNLGVARSGHAATKLANGRVLVTGGRDGNGTALITTEIYDPSSGAFTASPSMSAARTGHTATVLADGRILIAGGDAGSAEIYDPASNTFTFASGTMNAARSYHSSAL
ncbi:MAG: kelch repeat-containing protein, partial [Acidobacteriota bacterium]|nr:kelch repeat-containing protein [Acidobacteriota bacterium]